MDEQQESRLQEALAKKAAEAPTPTAAPEMAEDAGSQALADALRSSFAVLKIVMAGLVIVFLMSGFFKVGSQERAIILHFGKPSVEGDKALLGPGLHWAWPYPIDEVVKIPFTQIQSVRSTAGWYATTPEMEANNQEPDAGGSLNPAIDGYTITADGNIMHARATLQYRITDPIRYVFEYVNASNAVQHALDDALVFASAHTKVDDAITRDKTGFQDKVRARVQELIAQEKLGVSVEQCIVLTKAPLSLKQAFNNVLQAEIKRSQVLNAARTNENFVLSKASSDAAARINEAEAERTRMVEFVRADAKRFTDLLPQYEANPQLFINQQLAENLTRALTNVQDIFLLPNHADGRPIEIRMNLNREPKKMPGESEK